jgi:hypothetical protein
MEMRGSGPNRTFVRKGTVHFAGFPDPVSMTVCPYLSFALLTSSEALAAAACAGRYAAAGA